MIKYLLRILAISLISIQAYASVNGNSDILPVELENYCIAQHGQVTELTAIIDTHSGNIKGLSKKFCRLQSDGNVAYVGLDTLSPTPNLAATYTLKIAVDMNKPLPKYPYDNPSANVCSKLHGTEIVFAAYGGGFSGKEGETDICLFGDGSSISSWSMLYAASGIRPDIKNAIRAEPLDIDIPQIQ